MNRMNDWIKKKFNILLIVFILLQPLLDLMTGVGLHVLNMNVTIGIIFRMLFLFFVLYSVTFVFSKYHIWKYYSILILYGMLYIGGIYFFQDGNHLFLEIQGLFRVFYFPVLLIALYSIREQIKISNMTLLVVLGTYLLCIFIPNIFQIGFESYEITKKGSLGFFNSANEISGIISILTPFMILFFIRIQKIIPIIFFSFLYLVVVLTIGTKTPLLALGITIIATYVWLLWDGIIKRRYKGIVFLSTMLVVIVGILLWILPKTNFYKNIKTHMDYLKVTNFSEVLSDPQLIDHFIFSQRLTFLNNRHEDYMKANDYQKLFGIGYSSGKEEAKLIEMDYFDIYYSHGMIGFLLYFGGVIYVFYALLKNRKETSFDTYMLYVSILLIFILSLITGHMITSPAVSILIIVLLLQMEKQKKRLLFTAYHLKIGGIESALVNLTNRINKEKYDVHILLEKKEGDLLNHLDDNILVSEYKVYNDDNLLLRKFKNLFKRIGYIITNYHTYDFGCCYATYSLSGSKLAKIASFNNCLYVHSDYQYVYHEKDDFKKFFDARKTHLFQHIVFVSNESRKSFLSVYPQLSQKCLVINNFIDCKKIVEKSKSKVKENKPADKKLFVFVGRLDDTSKKLTRAIHLVQHIKNVELWIVGDGPDKEKYQLESKKCKVTKRVKFLGKKSNPYPYIKMADYIILTSDYEGFPVTYLEAILLKTPIITTMDVSDDQINIGRDYAWIISKEEDKMVEEVSHILKQKPKQKQLDFEKTEKNRMRQLEYLFDGVKI